MIATPALRGLLRGWPIPENQTSIEVRSTGPLSRASWAAGAKTTLAVAHSLPLGLSVVQAYRLGEQDA